MALDSTSTPAEALAEYRANIDSADNAGAALKAVRFILAEMAISTSGKSTAETKSEQFWLDEKKRLETLVSVTDGDSDRSSFTESRFLYQ